MVVTLLAGSPLLAQVAQQPKASPPQAEKSAEPTSPAPVVTPEPDPLQVLQKMCDFLKSQQQFTYKAEVADDQVYAGGKKLQYGIDMETFVRRPDRLRVNAEGDLLDKQFYFNGKTITLYDKDDNVYGTLEVPPNIESALEKASKEFGVRVALTDLASPKLCELIRKKVKHSLYAGLHKVRGVPCHHLAFDSDEVQLQLWIDAGDKPLPRKVVMNYKTLPASPQWTAYLSDWNFTPQLNDKLFAFTPPQGAEKIKFMPMKAGQAPKAKPKKKQGGKS
ncbi:MAG: DUF2092 domain-containing protein [Thermodesulfobacteriota bacterium]